MTTDPATAAAGLESALTALGGIIAGLGVAAPFVWRLLWLVQRFRAAYQALTRAVEGHKVEATHRGAMECTHVRGLTRRIGREIHEAGAQVEAFHAAQLSAAELNRSPILGSVLRGEAPQA